MLAKLMKYDLRSCLRKFGPLWLAVIALSALIGLSFRYVIDAPGGQSGLVIFLLGVLPSMVLFGLFVAMAVMALIFVIQRFYRGLLGDEGYLMFTLPASAGAHIASKGLTALILEILGVNRDAILADYLKTNLVSMPKAISLRDRFILTCGKEYADRVYQGYIADESYLQAAWDAMGDAYITDRLGITEEQIRAFRATVLE